MLQLLSQLLVQEKVITFMLLVWEKGAFAEGWIAESDLKSGSDQDFFAQCDWTQENGYYLVSATMYGSDN